MAKRADRRRRRSGEADSGRNPVTDNGSQKGGAGRPRITSRLGVKQTPLARANRPASKKGPEPTDRRKETKKPKSTIDSVIELLAIIAVALLLALGIQALVVKPYSIPSGSMEPTLAVGQRVLVNRLSMDFGKPHVGEIVVFHPPKHAEQRVCGPIPHMVTVGGAPCDAPLSEEDTGVNFIKRIVAGPGDVITIHEGHVIRNGVRESDSYTRPCADNPQCNFLSSITIPPGHWFMMGDNRGASDDSRYWGPVPTGWIIGGAFATYWPPDRVGFL